MYAVKRREKLLKVVLLGNSGVGKSSLLTQYGSQSFNQKHRPTIGADYFAKNLKIEYENVVLQIWDTAGQERFQSLGTAFYRGADCCVLVYDITDPISFQSIDSWKEHFLLHSAPRDPEQFPFVLLGNKIDRENYRQVSSEKAENWCTEHGDIPYLEVSAKNNTMIEEAFYIIGQVGLMKESRTEWDCPGPLPPRDETDKNKCAC